MTDCEQPSTFKSVMIHASAVEYKGKALVFLGPSETGKSTISQLLAGTLDDARVLADDIAYLAWQDEGWQVAGDTNPNFLQEALAALPAPISQSMPLGGVFRLYQAPLSRLEPLRSLETGLYLMNAFFEVSLHLRTGVEERKSYFASLSAIARAAPGYTFYFERSAQTADALQQEMVVL